LYWCYLFVSLLCESVIMLKFSMENISFVLVFQL
jgi:hypothetical protein